VLRRHTYCGRKDRVEWSEEKLTRSPRRKKMRKRREKKTGGTSEPLFERTWETSPRDE
jgi:hypothetical protein